MQKDDTGSAPMLGSATATSRQILFAWVVMDERGQWHSFYEQSDKRRAQEVADDLASLQGWGPFRVVPWMPALDKDEWKAIADVLDSPWLERWAFDALRGLLVRSGTNHLPKETQA